MQDAQCCSVFIIDHLVLFFSQIIFHETLACGRWVVVVAPSGLQVVMVVVVWFLTVHAVWEYVEVTCVTCSRLQSAARHYPAARRRQGLLRGKAAHFLAGGKGCQPLLFFHIFIPLSFFFSFSARCTLSSSTPDPREDNLTSLIMTAIASLSTLHLPLSSNLRI